MSTVVAWSAKDARGISSLYFVSESRISYSNQTRLIEKWDYGQKVFRLSCGGIIAYVGDVLYPTQLISQLKALIDDKILFEKELPNQSKINIIQQYIQSAFANIPIKISNTTIIIAFVQDNSFNFYELTYKDNNLTCEEKQLLADAPLVYGSGAKSFKEQLDLLKKSERYSRYIFQAFYCTIKKAQDRFSGGNIQMVGLYRNGKSQVFGIIENNERFVYGQKIVSYNEALKTIEWRNSRFEIMDVEQMRIKEKAQRQPMHDKFL